MIDYSDLALEKDDSELEFMDLICKYDYDLWDEEFEITPEFAQTMREVILRMFEEDNKHYKMCINRIYSNIIRARYKPCDMEDYVGILCALEEALDDLYYITCYSWLRNLDNYCNEVFNNLKNDIWDGRYIRDNNLTIEDFSIERILKDVEEMGKKIDPSFYYDRYFLSEPKDVIHYLNKIQNAEPFDMEPIREDVYGEDPSPGIDDLMTFYSNEIINNNLNEEIIDKMRKTLTSEFESMKHWIEADIGQMYIYILCPKYMYPNELGGGAVYKPDEYITKLTRDYDFIYYLNFWIREFDDGRDIIKNEYYNDSMFKDKLELDDWLPEECRISNIIHPRYILETYKRYDVNKLYVQSINREIENVNRKWGI